MAWCPHGKVFTMSCKDIKIGIEVQPNKLKNHQKVYFCNSNQKVELLYSFIKYILK